MRYSIIMNKLDFIWHLDNMDNTSLAKQLHEVWKMQLLLGLIKECMEWIKQFKLPTLDLRQKMTTLLKVRNSKMITDVRGRITWRTSQHMMQEQFSSKGHQWINTWTKFWKDLPKALERRKPLNSAMKCIQGY